MESAASAAASICDAATGNIVANCGFESGHFSSWTLSGNLEGGAPPNNFYGVDNTIPNSGVYQAYFGVQGGPNSVPPTAPNAIYPITLSQAITLLPAEFYSVSFYLAQDGPTPGPSCPDPGCTNYFAAYLNGIPLYAVKDQANTNGYAQIQLMTATSAGGSPNGLRFDFQNNDDYWFLDDVDVAPLGPTPEPASWLLVGPTLGGLLLLVRYRRRSA